MYYGFYSILVRLKDPNETEVSYPRLVFLFHTGSIKSVSRFKTDYPEYQKFLFHTGSIKRLALADEERMINEFLFHTGSIKRIQILTTFISIARFYSILVRLKVSNGIRRTRAMQVSIPYWFD